jgi:hypothetical protein
MYKMKLSEIYIPAVMFIRRKNLYSMTMLKL